MPYCAGYAAAVIRRFSAVLIALAISPVSLFMAGSCSSDGLFMGLTWIFIALCLSDVVTKKEACGAGALLFGLTFHAKYTTLALLPLLLLLPFEQKPRKGKKALSAAAQRWGVLAVCLAAGIIIYALLTGYTALASNYGRVLMRTPALTRAGSSRSFFPICRATWRSCSIPSTVTRQTSLPLGILDGWT